MDLTAEDQTVALARGETAEVLPGRPPRKVASLPVRSLIQWTFYYPAVLNPDDLAWSPADAERHARSLAAYRAGNLQAARDLLPADVPDASPSERLYRAALASAFGETEPADALPNFPEDARLASVRGALREIVAVAREDESAEIRPEPIPESASAWLARSYRRQLQRRLPEARAAAREAVRLAPGFGFAWARLAELEFGFGERAASKKARDTAAKLAPEHAAVAALEGFAALEDDEPRRALQEFARATARDASLPLAWVGQGLARAALRDHEEARRAFQIAAALEPRRGSYRGYLAKAFGETRDDALADKDFLLAMELDPADPTAWHDAALHDHQLNRRNQAIRRLETAVERNDNRAVFRPALLLDQDRAMRGANLAALYDDVG
ncbi:MAG: tetratricopeptide repeat protein, partial [Verrucomicrobiales bacterium]|nr:tetratricopeptide repeat protein [Verrucomicrobiales bacterium]